MWEGGFYGVSRFRETFSRVPARRGALGILVCLGGAALAFAPSLLAQTTLGYVITTVAGVGPVTNPKNNGFTGDGGPPTQAQLNGPIGVTLDAANTLYIADQVNNRVRQVPQGGDINTVAGDGTPGYSGDGGAAIDAELDAPCGMVVDPTGPFYIADYQNVVRKVEPFSLLPVSYTPPPTGTTGDAIVTVAGTGVYGFGGDGGIGIQTGPPAAEMAHPCGLALGQNGNLYIADSGNNRIRMINPTGYISTVAGSPVQGFSGDGGLATYADLNTPEGVAVDAAGNLYFTDTMNNRIRKLTFLSPCNGTTGNCPAIVTTVAGSSPPGGYGGFSGDGGPAIDAQLNRPFGIALDAAGNIFVADSYNQRVRMINIATGIITTIAGTGVEGFSGDGGPALSATFGFPTGIAVDNAGRVYVADTQNNVIRMITPTNCGSAFILGAVSAGDFGASKTLAPVRGWKSTAATSPIQRPVGMVEGATAPTNLAGVTVSVGGFSANLSYVSPTQVNALIPMELPVGAWDVYVFSSTGQSNGLGLTTSSNGYVINAAQTSPGLWAPPELMFGGKQYVGALFKDGSGLALPPGAVLTGDFAGMPSRPALPGDVIVLYGVGFGPVCITSVSGCVTFADGAVVTQPNTLQTTLDIAFGGAEGTLADITYAGLALGEVGVYEIDLVVPEVPASNVTTVTFNLGSSVTNGPTCNVNLPGCVAPPALYIAVAN